MTDQEMLYLLHHDDAAGPMTAVAVRRFDILAGGADTDLLTFGIIADVVFSQFGAESRSVHDPEAGHRDAGNDMRLLQRQQELTQFGWPRRFDMIMIPLLDEDEGDSRVVLEATSVQNRYAVEQFAHQFRRETRYDFAPFNATDEDAHGVLLLARRFRATFPIAAGAAGFTVDDDGEWCMNWIWVHPYERGDELIDRAWDELEVRYGQFRIEPPYSPAMESFLRRRAITPDRAPHLPEMSRQGGQQTTL
ncbi:hypothetical protein [Actinocatenispora thailandica]|nr:hypothetical protein [Actinocatenispora thailandica]